VIKIHFGFASNNLNADPQKDFYYDRYKTLPDYLNFPVTPYIQRQNSYMTTSPDSGLDAILSSKKDLILDKLSMLGSALLERRQIQCDIFKDIEKDSVWCQNELFAIETRYDPKLEREWKHKKLDLTREYRQEKASYFRDLAMLNKDIRDTMLEYLKEKQMEAIFR
jgi:hypothetical protein